MAFFEAQDVHNHWRYYMAIYELRSDEIRPLETTRFITEGILERKDLQRLLKRLLKSEREIFGERLLVIGEEFSEWSDSLRRIDLLCLDAKANLVVVELKRTEGGGHMELQALRYAAMVSPMTLEKATEVLARDRNSAMPDVSAAKTEIANFLQGQLPPEPEFGRKTRIILAAADFSDKELTTTVLWLNAQSLDIRCIRLSPVKLEDRLLLDVQLLIPLPEEAIYKAGIDIKSRAVSKSIAEGEDLRMLFWQRLIDHAQLVNRKPPQGSWLGVSIGRQNFSLTYCIGPEMCDVRLGLIHPKEESAKNKAAFNALQAERTEIETEFGNPLDWDEMIGNVQSRVSFPVEGGFRSAQENWPATIEELTRTMDALDKVFRGRVSKLAL